MNIKYHQVGYGTASSVGGLAEEWRSRNGQEKIPHLLVGDFFYTLFIFRFTCPEMCRIPPAEYPIFSLHASSVKPVARRSKNSRSRLVKLQVARKCSNSGAV